MLVLFYGLYSWFSLFFKWDFNVLEYIQFSCVHSLRKILMFILFINIPMCQPFVNMDISCFKMSFKMCMKNYYKSDVLKIPSYCHGWIKLSFVKIW
jgi:hypothetical protein